MEEKEEGVMIFENPKARRQLLEKGLVYTFRKHPHKEGRDWASAYRGGPKIADIYVKVVGRMRPIDLAPYVKDSGFDSLQEWIEAIRQFGIAPQEYGYLHEVILKK